MPDLYNMCHNVCAGCLGGYFLSQFTAATTSTVQTFTCTVCAASSGFATWNPINYNPVSADVLTACPIVCPNTLGGSASQGGCDANTFYYVSPYSINNALTGTYPGKP